MEIPCHLSILNLPYPPAAGIVGAAPKLIPVIGAGLAHGAEHHRGVAFGAERLAFGGGGDGDRLAEVAGESVAQGGEGRAGIGREWRAGLQVEIGLQQAGQLGGVVGVAHRLAQQGQTRRGKHLLDQLVAGLAIGGVVAGVVQLQAEQGTHGFWLAEQKVDVFAVDFVAIDLIVAQPPVWG